MFGPLIRFLNLRVNFVYLTVKDFFFELNKNAIYVMTKIYKTDIASVYLTLAKAYINYLFRKKMFINYFNNIEPFLAAIITSIFLINAVLNNGNNLINIFKIQNVAFFKNKKYIIDKIYSHIRTLFALFDYAVTN